MRLGILSTVMRDRGWGNMGAAEDVKRLPAEPGQLQFYSFALSGGLRLSPCA